MQPRVNSDGIPPEQKSRRYIGRYEIIYPIAHGGMASVYACRLTGLAGFQRLLAIKIVHPHLSTQKEFVEMFLDEARLSAGIHHPNVGEVFEVGEDDGTYYMVCELILGRDLRSVLRRTAQTSEPVPPEMCARIVSLAAAGVHAAHELKTPAGESLNIVHRDISPRNILLSYDGFVKLVDFGVAYARDKISHTDAGTLKGKVKYMSPEQVRCLPLDRRSDIFSLGVVLYELVTHQSPFTGQSDVERIKQILNYQFAWPANLKLDIPEQLETIIKRAMAYLPEDRYATAAAMRADLEVFIDNSDAVVNSEKLSSLMRSLFASERAVHLARIRALEELPIQDCAADTSIPARAEPTDGMPRHTAPVADAAEPHSSSQSTSTAGQEAKPLKTVPRAVKGGLIGMALVIVLWLVYVFMFTESGGPAAESTSGPKSLRHVRNTTVPEAFSLSSANAIPFGTDSRHDNPRRDNADAEVLISFEVHPTGVDVKLDGFPVSPRNNTLRLTKDGKVHRLQFFKKGYLPHEELVTADGDRRLFVSLSTEAPEILRSSRLKSKRNVEKKTANRGTKSGRRDTSEIERTAAKKGNDNPSGKGAALPEKNPY
ncbi:MAG: serine/threonine protein kinase [Deltaproteobacteria bacterium]|nr:serine/threonine protein kinase [Deltaproteobacteria bacterium]